MWNATPRHKFNLIDLTCFRSAQDGGVCVSVQSVAAANPSIVTLLRLRTQDAHSALEAQLGLLDRPASANYYAHLLLRFLGFHLVWENDLQEFPTLARELETRSRIRHPRSEFRTPRLTDAEIGRVPLCGDAHRFKVEEARALGSF